MIGTVYLAFQVHCETVHWLDPHACRTGLHDIKHVVSIRAEGAGRRELAAAFDSAYQTIRIMISGVEADPLLQAVVQVGGIHHGPLAQIAEVDCSPNVTAV